MRAIPPKVLRELRLFVKACAVSNEAQRERFLGAIDYALEAKRSAKPARQRRVAKKATKRDETAAIRQAVFARAGGLCEMCGGTATDLEHVFGRIRVKQSAANCAALCRGCHVERTRGRPSHSHWWAAYRELFLQRNEPGLARLCERKIDAARAKEAA